MTTERGERIHRKAQLRGHDCSGGEQDGDGRICRDMCRTEHEGGGRNTSHNSPFTTLYRYPPPPPHFIAPDVMMVLFSSESFLYPVILSRLIDHRTNRANFWGYHWGLTWPVHTRRLLHPGLPYRKEISGGSLYCSVSIGGLRYMFRSIFACLAGAVGAPLFLGGAFLFPCILFPDSLVSLFGLLSCYRSLI